MIAEKPSDAESARLKEDWNPSVERRFECDLRKIDERFDSPACKGEAVIVVRDGAGRVLMIRHPETPKNYWKLPQGRIEFGETVEQGALREAKEETGYDMEIRAMPAVHDIVFEFKRAKLERRHFIFLCDITGGDTSERDFDEIEEVAFTRMDDCGKHWGPFDSTWIPVAVGDATKISR